MKFKVAFLSLLVASSMQACCLDCTAAIEAGVTGTLLNEASMTMPAAEHICKSYWNTTDGTCCDSAKLATYWTTLQTEFETFKNKVKTEYKKIDMNDFKNLLSNLRTMVNTNIGGNAFITGLNNDQKT